MSVYKFIRKTWRGGSLCVVIAPTESEARRIAIGYGKALEQESGLPAGLLSQWAGAADCYKFDLGTAQVVAWAEC